MAASARTTLAFIEGFTKPAPREAHGTAHAAYMMCEAIARHGGYEALHVYRERWVAGKAARGELALPLQPPTRVFEKTALHSAVERYAAIYVANGSQINSAPHVLRPPNDWAPVIISVGTAHAGSQWTNLLVSLAAGAFRPGDGIIFKARSVQDLFRQAWDGWAERFGFVPPFPARTAVIPNGVDIETNKRSDVLRRDMRQQLRAGEGDVIFLSFSRLSPATKGDQQALIVRWKDVVAQVPGAILVLSGAVVDRAFVADLRALARAAGVGGRVLVLDNPFELAADARNRLMSAADVFIHLSTGLEEASPLVVHEAMAHGLPVIGTSWAGMRDIVAAGQTGFLVETRNAPLARSVVETVFGQWDLLHLMSASRVVSVHWPTFVQAARLLADGERRLSMGAAARQTAEGRALAVVAREYRNFFDASGQEAERSWTGPAACRPLVDLDQMVSAQATRPIDPETPIRLSDPSRASLLFSGIQAEAPAAVTRVLSAFAGHEERTFAELARAHARAHGDGEADSGKEYRASEPSRRDQAAAGRLLVRMLNFGVLEYA